ncbi:MAG: pyridoxal-dependent decarboxylase [Gemmatimonadota bacterium]
MSHAPDLQARGVLADGVEPLPAEPSLDPADWEAFERVCHQAVTDVTTHFKETGDGPAWQEIPDAVRGLFSSSMPADARPLEEVLTDVRDSLFPYLLGNTHPRFFGWVLGAGTPAGALAEFLAGSMNANMGGRFHAPMLVESQVLSWARELLGFPQGSSGLLVSGTSMATLIGLTVARHQALDGRDRMAGIQAGPRLVGYTSADGHQSIRGAFNMLGLGEEALRAIPTLPDGSMDLARLADAVAEDRSRGLKPFAVIATAGTVTCGAIDDLPGVRKLTRREGLWMHVDGAFGASLRLAPALAPRVAGIDEADSLAFDFHKWFHVPYDAGCVLIRDSDAHLQTFGGRQDYLQSLEAGPGAGDVWPCDLGPEMSRGFRAFKIWFTLQALGSDAIGRAVEKNCEQARLLAARIGRETDLELLGPSALNIVNFRFRPRARGRSAVEPAALDRLNHRLLLRLHTEGIAVPSPIRREGHLGLRVCICNHRTRQADLDALVDAVLRLGGELTGSPRAPVSP